MAQCQWKPNNDPNYVCPLSVEDGKGGPDSCYFHWEDESKSVGEMTRRLEVYLDRTSGDLDLRGFIFSSNMNFRDMLSHPFSRKINLDHARLGSNADFAGVEFKNAPSFYWAKFGDEANFQETQFNGGANFYGATFGEKANFRRASILGRASFDEATFGEKAIFEGTIFPFEAEFPETRFCDRAYFDGAAFNGGANFYGATFGEKAYFRLAKFSDKANFWKATFGAGSNFQGAIFDCKADFVEATFGTPALFRAAKFGRGIDFSDVKFEGLGLTSFAEVAVNLGAHFYRTSFRGRTDFKEATFSRLLKNGGKEIFLIIDGGRGVRYAG